MTTIAPRTANPSLARPYGGGRMPGAAAPGTERSGSAAGPAASVTLSDAAKAALKRADTGQQAIDAMARTFDERVQVRTDALADRLTKAFAADGIPLDQKIDLRLDATGRIATDSPYKKKIDKIFENDPDLAKEFEAVATLNTLRAAQKALDLFAAEKKAARDDDERVAAFGRYTARSMTLQGLSGSMTLKDGALSSSALAYVETLSGPKAPRTELVAVPASAKRADDAGADPLERNEGLPSTETRPARARTDTIGLIRSGLEDPDKWIGIARRLGAGEIVPITEDGRTPTDDESFQDAVNLDLGRKIAELEDDGRMDQARSLRAAIADGTLEIRTSSDVPDLNLRYTVAHSADAGGGGTRSDWHWNPVGDGKSALDGGRAMVFGGGDRGAFYVGW